VPGLATVVKAGWNQGIRGMEASGSGGMNNMRYLGIFAVIAVCLAVSATAQATEYAYEWNFTNTTDYYASGSGSVSGYVTPQLVDEAAIFARINTRALIGVDDITGGGFTVSGMNNPTAVYGSLYLSPTGGPGSTVMINMSPMVRTGLDGAYEYTFDLTTPADVKIRDGVFPLIWGLAKYTGTFGGAIDWVYSNGWSDDYAAFFGPQIGMSGTSGTTFTVSQIGLNAVPEPVTMAGLMMGIGGLVTYVRKHRKA
jgi:hypothetical protein